MRLIFGTLSIWTENCCSTATLCWSTEAAINDLKLQLRITWELKENSQKGMYAGYIAALRKDAKITMMKMSQIAGCSPAEYSSYEHERKEFNPEIYRKCEKYLKKKEGGGRC